MWGGRNGRGWGAYGAESRFIKSARLYPLPVKSLSLGALQLEMALPVMKRTIALSALALLCVNPLNASTRQQIADGDVDALEAAFAAAAESATPVHIVLARGGSYRLPRGLRLQAGRLTLHGNGAAILPAPSDSPSLFGVSVGADLRVEHLAVVGDPLGAVGIPLTDVAGQLELRASVFDSIVGSMQANRPEQIGPLNRIEAGASVRLENVTLRHMQAPCIQIGRGCQASYPVWSVAGELVLDSSTLGRVTSFAQPGLRTLGTGQIVVRNSIEAQPAVVCAAGMRSEGGNVWAQDACVGPGDQLSTLVSAVSLPDAEVRGGLVPTLAWTAPGYPPTIGRDCLPADARGGVRPAQGCTPGALELNAQFGDDRLASGEGSAGIWYDPGNDGHYLQIQPLPDGQMLLTWMHFDSAGQPAWAHLVARPQAGRITGEALRNRASSPVGGLHGGVAEPWGQLDITLERCDRLQMRYASDAEGPGSGSVSLRRLTALPAVGCR